MPVTTIKQPVRIDHDGGDEHDSYCTLCTVICDFVLTLDQMINGLDTYTTKNVGYVSGSRLLEIDLMAGTAIWLPGEKW